MPLARVPLLVRRVSVIAGVILAAGFASRMGRCKPLLPAPEASALETAAVRMRAAGVARIIVVTGHRAERVAAEAARLGCETAHNPGYESGMFGSVITGVGAAARFADACFLLPADIPLVKTYTYKSVIGAFCGGDTPDIAHPVFMGSRSHPPLLGSGLFAPLLERGGGEEGGLRGFLSRFPHKAIGVPAPDRATVLDMDTPEDYENLIAYAKREFYPDPDECAELQKIAGTPERAVRHMAAAAVNAGRIAAALSRAGAAPDMNLTLSACLLHDIAKGEPDHEVRGARWLAERGYARVAEIIASHKYLPAENNEPEAEILYLADKITRGTETLTLDARLDIMESQWPEGSEALCAARLKIARAAGIQKKIEAITGMTLAEILRE